MIKLFEFLRKGCTIEELLVIKVMDEVNSLLNMNPFEFLTFSIGVGNVEEKKFITYIVHKHKLYVDTENLLGNPDRRTNFSKYCFRFNGKPKNFLDLDKYEFIYMNLSEFKAVFIQAIQEKKRFYGLDT